jgi:nucleotide-binding universal stress UspA family protein
MKILVAYDGSLNSKIGLNYGLKKAKKEGGELVALHVFHAGMFVDYGAGPGAEQTARAESLRYVEEARKIIREKGEGLRASVLVEEGVPEEEILGLALEGSFDLLIAPPRFNALVRKAPCPVSIVPGAMLVPVDHSGRSLKTLQTVGEEAKETGSKVVLIGVVPVHMYGESEKDEIEQVNKKTLAVLKESEDALHKMGVETETTVKSGFPDEEIIKVARKYAVSMIIFPEDGGEVPSELAKAATLLLDEPEKVRQPVLLVPAE